MHVVRVIIFDIRGRPIHPATRGNGWRWFEDRRIMLVCLDNSQLPRGESFHVRRFHTISTFKRYLGTHTDIKPTNVVYVSDRLRLLQRAKTKFHFLTLAVPPARSRKYTNCACTSFPNTASLVGQINLLDWLFRPESTHPENIPRKASEK